MLINPLKNISNSDKFFFVGDGIRNVTDRDDRHNERVIALPRAGMAEIDKNFMRSVPIRETSNKTQRENREIDESRLYYNMPTQQPLRGSQITSTSERFDDLTYFKPSIVIDDSATSVANTIFFSNLPLPVPILRVRVKG